MKPGSCEGQPVLDVVSAFQSYGKFLEEGSTPEAEKRRYETVRNSCRKDGGACGGECSSSAHSRSLGRVADLALSRSPGMYTAKCAAARL